MRKILIVDDSPFYAKTISDSLPKKEYAVVVAKDGLEALTMVDSEKPDLILLDLALPKLDGIGFLKKIQEQRGQLKIPIFIFSNTNSMDKVSEGVALGVRGYIVKSTESLKSIVDNIK